MEKRHKNQDRMFNIVEEYLQKNISVTEIIKKHQITRQSFTYWREYYLKHQGHKPTEGSFIKFQVDSEKEEVRTQSTMIKIIYPNMVTLVLENTKDLFLIKQLINL